MASWELIDSEILESDGTSMEVNFDSAINFADVQSFAIYFSASLDVPPAVPHSQDCAMRIGTGGSVISSGNYEAYGIVIQDGGQALLNSSYGESSWRTENSNGGGTFIGLMYLTMNPLTDFPHMVMTVATDNRTITAGRSQYMMSCGGFLNSTLTSLQNITLSSSNNLLEESRIYVYKVLNS